MRGNRLFRFFDYWLGILLSLMLFPFVGGKRTIEPSAQTLRRIIIAKLAALGDSVLLIPALRALRTKFPNSEITFVGTVLTRPFLTLFPEYVDRFITIDVAKIAYNPRYVFGLVRELRKLKCDVAVDFEQWTHLMPILFSLAGIPVRLGFRTPRQYRHFLLTHWIRRSPECHEVDNFLRLARLLVLEDGTRELEGKVDGEYVQTVKQELCDAGWDLSSSVVVLHPGCGIHGYLREWPVERYAELADRVAKNPPTFFVISGTPDEMRMMNKLEKLMAVPHVKFPIRGLEQFTALLSLSSLFISGNNGAMHIAAALGTGQIALHGPTNSQQWGPLNPHARIIVSSCPDCPCLDLGSEYHRTDGYCMAQIGVEEVHRVALEMLQKSFSKTHK